MRQFIGALAVAAVLSLGVVACGGDDSGGGGGSGGGSTSTTGSTSGGARIKAPDIKPMASLGKGEGKVSLVNWAGYVEDGSTDPKVDWVTDFEKQTGCQVTSKVANTSDEMVTLMRTGQYDGVSASGDAPLRLIAGGAVAPVNTKLVPHYADVFSGLNDKPWNSVDGQMYWIPHRSGAR